MDPSKRLEELLKQGSVRMISRGKDVYDRLVADAFVDGQNVGRAAPDGRFRAAPLLIVAKSTNTPLDLKRQSWQDAVRILPGIARHVISS